MKWFRKSWPYAVLLLLLVVNVTVWFERENIADWWRLRSYSVPSDIQRLAADDTMTDYAKRLFYVNHPSLESKDDFNMHCGDKAEQTAVLGCYHGNRQGIYIYAVTDDRLAGVRQVTAAHEMLHQAYDRLSAKDRAHIDALLENYYTHDLTDQTIKDKLDSYRQQPGVVLVDEMHSIFGTEIRNLPPELEQYYKRYFTDRSKIVDYRDAYQAEFTRRETAVKQYDAQLATLQQQITADKASLQSKMDYLNSKEAEINQDAANHDQSAYQAAVQAYNATVTDYNALLTTTKKLINTYNDIVNQRNAIALQEQQLQQALDSRLATPSTK